MINTLTMVSSVDDRDSMTLRSDVTPSISSMIELKMDKIRSIFPKTISVSGILLLTAVIDFLVYEMISLPRAVTLVNNEVKQESRADQSMAKVVSLIPALDKTLKNCLNIHSVS
jgi:hypothetical protein